MGTSTLQTRDGVHRVSPYNMKMPLLKMGTLAQLPADSVMEVMVGDQPYAICNVGGTVRALSGVCIHRGGPLGQGQIHEGNVVCPYHLWEFDCASGEYDYDPTKRVPTFEVKVEDGDIFVQVP
jgi:nitrite reductase/ring-hydroxylating ferredoxin subunit